MASSNRGPSSSTTSPELRPASPSPSVSPSLALGGCPSLDGSASIPSTSSTLSSRSVSDSSQPSDASSTIRRRNGFMRPQGTSFADSARHRDSVMCLGSIAALQYYFARTGLLDGKGAQMAKERKDSTDKTATGGATQDGPSADQDVDEFWETMAAPAVSTYRHKEPVTEPLPDMPLLRRQLRQALDDAQKVLLEEAARGKVDSSHQENTEDTSDADVVDTARVAAQAAHELQGLHILDVVTLAIRQARMYYVTHTQPQVLYALRPERQIRSDLYQVLDILKRMAARDFRGGIRLDEQSGIISWVHGIQELLTQEETQEAEELIRIRHSPWRSGDWSGREREREWLFLNSFNPDPSPLPPWESTSSQPSDFLSSLSTGLTLIRLHNEMVRRSKRPFGEITTLHTDFAKPYRCAENLRYWAKAAELRWEIKLSFNALDVVNGSSQQAWLDFEQAIQTWCTGVREELSKEWQDPDSRPVTATEAHPSCGAPDNNAVVAF